MAPRQHSSEVWDIRSVFGALATRVVFSRYADYAARLQLTDPSTFSSPAGARHARPGSMCYLDFAEVCTHVLIWSSILSLELAWIDRDIHEQLD